MTRQTLRRATVPVLLAALAFASIASPAVFGQTPTTLDTSFGTNGTVDPDASDPEPTDLVSLALLRTDQFVGATGRFGQGRLRRITASGLVESGVAHSFELSQDYSSAHVTALPDGQVIACGAKQDILGGIGIRVRRSNLLGGEVRGPVTQGFGSPFHIPQQLSTYFCRALDQQSGGRLVIGGMYTGLSASQGPVSGPWLRWLRPDGSADGSLLGGGAYHMAADALGANTRVIEAVGEAFNGSTLVAARYGGSDEFPYYYATGSTRIRRIGAQGVATDLVRDFPTLNTSYFSSDSSVHLRVLPNEDFQVFYTLSQQEIRVERWSPNGQTQRFARSFITPSTHGIPTIRDIAMRPDGSALLLVSARQNSGTASDFWIAKVLNNGLLDPDYSSVGTPGFARLDLPAAIGPISADQGSIAIDRQGRILTAVTGVPTSGVGTRRPFIQRRLGEAMTDTVNWPLDLLPDPITVPFASAQPGELVTSDWIEIGGLSPGVRVPLYVLDGEYTNPAGNFTVEPRMVGNGYRFRLRGRAPTTLGQTRVVRVHVGGIRAQRSWDSLGPRVEATFAITASLPPLPGENCLGGGLNTNCTAHVPAGGTLTSTINRLGHCPWIRRIRVGVDVEAQRLGDLRIIVQDPNAPILGSAGKVMLIDQPTQGPGAAGSCTGQDIQATFADYAGESAGVCRLGATPAITGVVRPVEALGALVGRAGTGSNGTASNGIWTLIVRDIGGNAGARLRDWSVDIECSTDPIPTADLAVTVSGPANASQVAPTSVVFTITNNGPNRAMNALFASQLAQAVGSGWNSPSWTCSASAGSSCGPVAGCGAPPCLGHAVNQPLDLAVGGSATVTINATNAQSSGLQSMTGQASLQNFIPQPGVAWGDPIRANNEATWSAPVQTAGDLRALALVPVSIGNGSLVLGGIFENAASFIAQPVRLRMQFPPGFTPLIGRCLRLGSMDSCDTGNVQVSGQTITMQSAVVLPGEDYGFEVSATYNAGNPPPPGTVTFTVDYDPGSGVTDPNPSNNVATLPIVPPPATDLIFRNDFEN